MQLFCFRQNWRFPQFMLVINNRRNTHIKKEKKYTHTLRVEIKKKHLVGKTEALRLGPPGHLVI